MRLLILLLLATFFVIAHAETDTDYSPAPPPPAWGPVSPSPSWTPAWTPVSSPPSWTPASTPSSPPPPPPPTWTPSSPPPPPTASPPPPLPAPWTPVKNVKAKEIQQVGQFAVYIYTLTWHTDLVFVNVVSCETQPSAGGYIYRVLIAVSGTGAKSPQYYAVVWGILGTRNWELRSFDSTK